MICLRVKLEYSEVRSSLLEKEEIMAARMINRDECQPVRQHQEKLTLPSKITVESGVNTPEFPPLSRPDFSIVDSGRVRLGDGFITAEFPPRT